MKNCSSKHNWFKNLHEGEDFFLLLNIHSLLDDMSAYTLNNFQIEAIRKLFLAALTVT